MSAICTVWCVHRGALGRAAPAHSQEHNFVATIELKQIVGVEHRFFRPQPRNFRIMAIRCGWPPRKVRDSFMASRRAFATLTFVLIALHTSGQNAKSKQLLSGFGFRNTAPGVRYIGSKICAGCHATIYQQFSHTDMARSTALPSKVFDFGWLTKPVDIFNEKHNRHYQIFARDSKVYQSEYALDDEGKELFRHSEELAYLIGTGSNGDTPVIRRGNYLFEAPLSYYTATKSWALSPNYDVRDMGFSFPVTADCIGCHTGKTQPVLGRNALYQDSPVTELSIGCENCHGPGQLHVRERIAGTPTPNGRDRSIVNPAQLPAWLADNICMNCHEGDIRALQPGKFESDFRPGTPLNNTVLIFKAPIDTRAEQSPLLEHYYSMTLSQCYRGSGGQLGCQSCHDPHVQPSKQDAPLYFRTKCLACHTEKSCPFDSQMRLAQQPQDACTNCHMTKRPALTVSHSALTDHRITRVGDESFPQFALKPSLAGTGLIHVNAVPGQPDKVPPVALLKAYRKELIRGRLEFKEYYFSLLDHLSRSGSQDPFVLSAIAQKAGSDGNLSKAIRYAKQVIAQGSTSDSDYLLLDGFLARSGNLRACIEVLKKGISITPYSNSLYESLASRQLTAGNAADGMATLQRGLDLFPEDSILRDAQQRALSDRFVREGIVRFKQGNHQGALDKFRAAVQANPRDAVAHDYIGIIQGESGMLEEAITEFLQASRLDHAFPEPHFHLGLAYSRNGKTLAAISEYQQALRLNPKLPEAQYGLSAICAKAGDTDGAIVLLHEVIKAEPNFAEAHENLGLNLWNRYKDSAALRQKGDLDEAVQELKTASALEPRQSRTYFALGEILSDRGDLASAVENLQRAVDLHPSNADYHYSLGLALRLRGNLDAADSQFRAALTLNPRHALAHRSLGLVLRENGDLDAAATELRFSVSQLPDDAQGHHLLGTVLLKMNDLAVAIEELRRAISLDPKLSEARANLVQALQKAGRKEEAQREIAGLQTINTEYANVGQSMILIETAAGHTRKGEFTTAVGELQQAVSLSPGLTEAQYQLALALQRAGNFKESEEVFRRVLQMSPDHASAHLQLGLLFADRGAKAQASTEFEKALQLAPGLVEAHAAWGKLAKDSQDWLTATQQFEAVLAWKPQDAATHYDLAIVLKATGQTEEATREMRIAQQLAPATVSR
jgi:tetratricopeptide (TPR) repeat protein